MCPYPRCQAVPPFFWPYKFALNSSMQGRISLDTEISSTRSFFTWVSAEARDRRLYDGVCCVKKLLVASWFEDFRILCTLYRSKANIWPWEVRPKCWSLQSQPSALRAGKVFCPASSLLTNRDAGATELSTQDICYHGWWTNERTLLHPVHL